MNVLTPADACRLRGAVNPPWLAFRRSEKGMRREEEKTASNGVYGHDP